METTSLAALALYTFVMCITPGPNNLMLTTSGLIFGMARTCPHILGIAFGAATQLIAVGAGLGAVFAVEPRLQIGLKLIGSLYLLWLAGKLWRAAELRGAALVAPVTFFQAAAFQFVNPKAWLIAVTVIAAFVSPGDGYALRIALVCAVFAIVGTPCLAVWAAFGAGLRRILHDPAKLLFINRTMAALSAITAGMFWL
ncbi:threonine/homoserine/homoserine lactone efflux protein [Rhodopseudomonas thermotolerans]|uniref:Threonine/homoserine/homoserine lactone efflux protein n=2 Tax=Rhodopseudomonas TaxID=1073 RepID=A0A336JJA0_9BRAD|nr:MULTISPECIES: LysE family translocator [Rhodopseudomonas]RED38365.1 threonine/homoserine/homoserine lactone efflux protein [Rhodopseudomonas pentothenatexigens]REG05950.1 threonine/homoserine/homoserine lactone efflux protein [Rhodopseudomonas thermotolerans]SSW89818.1 threonine/homoserine/homoserine lactone efflux protein [Rhodopseudomonas pentothenatexigens]